MKTFILTYRQILFAAMTLLLLVGFAPVLAADREENSAERVVELPTTKLTLEKKTLAAVISNTGDRYRVSDETIIADANGNQVPIRKMLVPCEAEVTFITEGGLRKAHYIKILQIGRYASWQWISETPD